MPHFIIECSEELLLHHPPDQIMKAVYDSAESTGLFLQGEIKVRINPYRHYFLSPENKDFIHIFGNIMEGRSSEQKTDLSKRIIKSLDKIFPDISILSINIMDFRHAGYWNKAMLSR